MGAVTNKLKCRQAWTRATIVDLPYMPFEPGDETERSVIDYVAKRIIGISKAERRRDPSNKKSKDFNFDKSTCIVAVNVPGIETSQVSYLENLPLLTHIYPFMLINCCARTEALLGLHLHERLISKGYILPVFQRIPAVDVLYSARRYGTPFTDLLTGQRTEVHLSEVKGLGTLYRREDLLERFRGLAIADDLVTFAPPVLWLGVESSAMQNGLSSLFNRSTEAFDPSEFCEQFSVEPEILEHYLTTCMLFGAADGSNVQFRLRRNAVYTALMRAAVDDFEREMTDRSVIDTTRSEYAAFSGKFVEYHSMGRLFDRRDTFALNFLSYVRAHFRGRTFTKVVVIDNGQERALCELLPKILPGVHVVRAINYFGNPMLSPFDPIEEGDDVVVLCDLVNTGRFLEATLKLLATMTRKPAMGVFSFIIDVALDTKRFFDAGLVASDGAFLHHLKKKLDPVPAVLDERHASRFSAATPEAYLLFWNTANRLCDCERELTDKFIRVERADHGRKTARALRTFRLDFKNEARDQMNETCPFYRFLTRMLTQGQFTAAVFFDDAASSTLGVVLKAIQRNIDIVLYPDPTGTNEELERLTSHKNIIIFTMAINAGTTLSTSLDQLRKHVHADARFSVISLLTRDNPVSETEELARQSIAGLLGNGVTVNSFYTSHLPYYLISQDAPDREHAEGHIKRLFEET